MPFDKYKGKCLDDLPLDYKIWLAGLIEEDCGKFDDIFERVESSLFPSDEIESLADKGFVNKGFVFAYKIHKDIVLAMRSKLAGNV